MSCCIRNRSLGIRTAGVFFIPASLGEQKNCIRKKRMWRERSSRLSGRIAGEGC